MRLHVVRLSACLSVTFRYCDHVGWNTSKIISPPNSDKIVMWRFLRNCRLVLRLHTIFRALIYWAHRAVIFAIAWFSCNSGCKIIVRSSKVSDCPSNMSRYADIRDLQQTRTIRRSSRQTNLSSGGEINNTTSLPMMSESESIPPFIHQSQ